MVLRPCNDAKQFVELKYLKGVDNVSIRKTFKEDNEDTTAGKENTRLASSFFKSSNGSSDQATDSAQLYDKAKKKCSSSIKDLKLSEKNKVGLQSKSVLVEKSAMTTLLLDELDGRIVVRQAITSDNSASPCEIRTGDILLSVDHVNLIGMSLEEAQSFVNEKLKHKNDSISVVIATNLDGNNSHHSAIVNSNWCFAQKDSTDIDENDSVFNTKF
ncbi:uncharacterized protein LOC124455066 [Xenia sp. Carnegie-2017]|uniref:uncharacterized protein LOC124455066 n=1 Tax=Xenia sp. Carnegie-2017 TaxID=2897299 RepID=UPI001F04C83C|nr:uncharacterized protein LOC124455066 [Xenia sp. Carnegie-2017]